MSQMLVSLAVSLFCFNSLFKAAVPVTTSLRDLGLMETFSLQPHSLVRGLLNHSVTMVHGLVVNDYQPSGMDDSIVNQPDPIT